MFGQIYIQGKIGAELPVAVLPTSKEKSIVFAHDRRGGPAMG